MNPLARTDRKMVLTLGANLQVLIKFLVKNHRAAFWTFSPQPLWDFALLGFGSELGLFDKARIIGGWRSDGRFHCRRLELQRFFGKSGGHARQTLFRTRSASA